MFHLNTGRYICQICDHHYDGPLPRAVAWALS
jgi:hypothetical protein